MDASLKDNTKHVIGTITKDKSNISGFIDAADKNITANVRNITAGTSNYNNLVNKPTIEGVELTGNRTFEDLNLTPLSNADLAQLLD